MSTNGTDYSSLVSEVWNYAHVLRDQGIRSARSPLLHRAGGYQRPTVPGASARLASSFGVGLNTLPM